MNQTPLKEFEQNYEKLVRMWIRYFFNIEEYLLIIEIMIDRKQAMRQAEFVEKVCFDGKRDRLLKVIDDLYLCYILDKRELILQEKLEEATREVKDVQVGKEGNSKNQNVVKETTEQRNKKLDETTVWGFDFSNLSKFKEYITRMKDDCESQKKKNEIEIEANDTKVENDREREEQLLEENKQLTKFTDKSLKIIEDQLDEVYEAENKTDIKKSMYYPDNFEAQLTQERDESLTFQIATEQLKVKQYARLFSYCMENAIFKPEEKDEIKEDPESTNNTTTMASPEKKKKSKKI